ncbi:MAG: glycosyltransferase family 4 protein [Kiloniellaceae bacterium]
MKIAQVSPLIESVPPKFYGGTERIVSYLTEELVRQGHEVMLFASGDSQTSAELVPCSPKALRLDPRVHDPFPHYMLMLEQIRRRADDFDILHFHIDYLHYPLFRDIASRTVTTQHGRLDLADLQPLFAEFEDMPLVSISDRQRQPLPSARWVATVYHGLPPDLHSFSEAGANGYLAFLGRICPEKRPDRAIEIARRTGIELKIAAKVDKVDRAYFEEVVRPLLDDPLVEFVGEIGEERKTEFLGGARALLFPIDWPEPFGLVMIEAIACGTPVIAWRCGSVPEVIDQGVNGFVVDSIDGAVAALEKVDSIDRRGVRRGFEARFTVERMARNYLRVYESLVSAEPLALRVA